MSPGMSWLAVTMLTAAVLLGTWALGEMRRRRLVAQMRREADRALLGGSTTWVGRR